VTNVTLADRAIGSLLGLALGDALGAPFEGRRADAIPDPLPAFDVAWRDRPPFSTTDDTAMALNLAVSLAERGGFDADDVLRRHLAWFEADPPNVGTLTRRVLRAIRDRAAPAREAARLEWERRGPEVAAGNGSVMYCAPLGVAYARHPHALIEAAPALSALTHYDERCRTACLAVTLATAALVRGERPEKAVGSALEAVIDRSGGEELEFLAEAVGVSRPVDGPDRGFCLYAAAVGMQAVLRPGTPAEEFTRVVRLGGDTDTNAAVAGALLGARDGKTSLPDHWLARLQGRHEIERVAAGLVALAAKT